MVRARSSAPRRPEGWRAPGPAPAGAQGDPSLQPLEDEDLSYLSGDFRIFQKRRGHRWSMDDLTTAWVATRPLVNDVLPVKTLDLGCGLGSVLMMTAWALPHATCLGMEAQAERAGLARRSLAFNGIADRCEVLDGDFRETALPAGRGPFELITCTPPYFPEGTATEAASDGVTACRVETRGGIEDYLAAALPHLAANGRIVACSSALQRERIVASAASHHLIISEHVEVIPLEGKAALICIDVFQREAVNTSLSSLTIRDAAHQWTAEFKRVRDDMGLPSTVARK